jgi:hypothetical protein
MMASATQRHDAGTTVTPTSCLASPKRANDPKPPAARMHAGS